MESPIFERLVIHGVGLLGGSLGMALRERGLARRIVGLGRSAERLERARACRAIDEATTDPATALRGADGIVLALPPSSIVEALPALAPHLAPGAFVTDVGSVKASIATAARSAFAGREIRFVGSHPMTGGDRGGIENACAGLYAGAPCIVTPAPETPPEAVAAARALWSALEMRVVEMSPTDHDALLARVSHLPHLLAAALMQTLGAGQGAMAFDRACQIAGPGLRDATRIAGGDAELWGQIFSNNAVEIGRALDEYIETLQSWRSALNDSDPINRETKLSKSYHLGRELRHRLDRAK